MWVQINDGAVAVCRSWNQLHSSPNHWQFVFALFAPRRKIYWQRAHVSLAHARRPTPNGLKSTRVKLKSIFLTRVLLGPHFYLRCARLTSSRTFRTAVLSDFLWDVSRLSFRLGFHLTLVITYFRAFPCLLAASCLFFINSHLASVDNCCTAKTTPVNHSSSPH